MITRLVVELVGDTLIKNGVTSSSFKSTPDVPFTSFELVLPQGPFSALAANGNLCTEKLVMPTEFTAQNDAQVKQNTKIAVTGCAKAVRHVRKKTHRKKNVVKLVLRPVSVLSLGLSAMGVTVGSFCFGRASRRESSKKESHAVWWHLRRFSGSHQAMQLALSVLGIVLVAALAAGASHAYAAGCSNEVLRSGSRSLELPECRAYELASPVAKNGWPVQVVNADGSHMLMYTLGSFGNSTQGGIFNYFSTERTSEGWRTSPFVVPTGLINTSTYNLAAASNDLGTGLFEYRSASGLSTDERNFYLQQLPDGSKLPDGRPCEPRPSEPGPSCALEVGPAFPREALESSPAGSTREISGRASMSSEPCPHSVLAKCEHVLFTIMGPTAYTPGVDDLWPGDSTVPNGTPTSGRLGFGSLYEYVGTGNTEPKLVGVSNEGPLVSNEEAQLISQCGTSLGFPREGVFTQADFPLGEAYNAISGTDDVTRVFFTAAAAREGPGGDACTETGQGRGPFVDELYTRIDATETVAVSEPSLSVPGRVCSGVCREDETQEEKRSSGFFQGASEDGSRVFFLTAQPLIDGDEDGATDLYEAEIGGGPGHGEVKRLMQVSHAPSPGEAAEVQGVARVSEDGSHVYFLARGVLTLGANPVGSLARPGADNLYVYNTVTGHLGFIGDLCSGAETSGAVTDVRCPASLNSEPPNKNGLNDLAGWQQEDTRPFDASSDGRFAVFTSYAQLTPGDTSTVPQVFEYDAEAEALVRVSVGENGFNMDGNTAVFGARIVAPSYAESQNPAMQLTSVSDDGSVVVFQSSAALTAHAIEGYPNVYEYRHGQVYLISDGVDRTLSLEKIPATSLVGMDGSGQDIFFTTADQLVPVDGDSQADVYDARSGGGFAPPVGRLASCEGDGCQGASASNPSFLTAGSASQIAGENVVPPPNTKPAVRSRQKSKCAKGRKLSRGKCVRAKHGRRAAAKKSARDRKVRR